MLDLNTIPTEKICHIMNQYGYKCDKFMVAHLRNNKMLTLSRMAEIRLRAGLGLKQFDIRKKNNKFTWRCDDKFYKRLIGIKKSVGNEDTMQDFMTDLVEIGLQTVAKESVDNV